MLIGSGGMPALVVATLEKALNESLAAPALRKTLQKACSTMAPPNVDRPHFVNRAVAKRKKIMDDAKTFE